jgi:hypothetical protein
MLARANSDAATRLRRSKSTSAVHKRPTSIVESIDLEAVRQQALAAATVAYTRAHAQNMIECTAKRNSDVLRSKSNASRKSLTFQGNHFPPRGSSFRSMQAQKVAQTRDSQQQSQALIFNTEQATEQSSSSYPTPAFGGAMSVSRQSSTHHSTNFSEKARSSSQQKTCRPGTVSSVASQQIRKARSMYYASIIQTGSPIGKPPAEYLTTPVSDGTTAVSEPSTMHPSVRVLGHSPLAEPRIPVSIEPGVTLDEARDKYLHEFQQRSVKHKPSLFLAPFKKRQEKAKYKAKSDASDTHPLSVSREPIPNEPINDNNLSDFLPQQEVKEKRSFSGSLKHRIKKVFRRTSAKPIDLPVQHIEASRDYFDAPQLSPGHVYNANSIPCPDEITLQRVRGRTTSLESARPIYLRSDYRSDSAGSAPSIRSLHSEVNAPHVPSSRVTSWGTTSTSDTPTQRTIKRMTVIHESKDSIGSEKDRAASLKASRRKSMPLPPLSSFREPMPMETLPEEKQTPIDPKRVFSALMREIGATKCSQESTKLSKQKTGAESDIFGSSTVMPPFQTRDLHSSGSHNTRNSVDIDRRPHSRLSSVAQSVRSKTSTIKSLGRAIRSTIRAVTPIGNHLSPETEGTDPPPNIDGIYKNDDAPQQTTKMEREGIREGSSTMERGYEIRTFIPSASQIENPVERARNPWKAHLEKAENPHFPRETDMTFDVARFGQQPHQTPNGSNEQIKKAQSPEQITINQGPDQSKPITNTINSPQPKIIMTPMSPSIYSRNTDGISINPNDSVMSFDGPDQPGKSHDAGSAVILTSQAVRSYVVGTPSPQRQGVSHTSRDWRAWLSHEVSGMEFNSQEDLNINERYKIRAKRDSPDSTILVHSENEGEALGLRGPCNTTTTKPDTRMQMTKKAFFGIEPRSVSNDCTSEGTRVGAMASEERNFCPNTSNTDDSQSIHDAKITMNSQIPKTSIPRPTSFASKPRPISTSGSYTSYRTGFEIPKQLSSQEYLAFNATGPRYSSNSLSSRHSKSPTDSMISLHSSKSLNTTPRPALRSSLPSPPANTSLQHRSTTPLKRSDTQLRRKENAIPLFIRNEKESSSPLNLHSRPNSQQLLSLATLNRSSPTTDQRNTKPQPSLASTPLRPRVRIVVRPISPEKLTRRPTSAFDLRARKFADDRNTIAAGTTSPSSLRKHSAGLDADIERSVTPGHRMADQFLRERNSATGLGGSAGRRRGGMVLVREDTPAFL